VSKAEKDLILAFSGQSNRVITKLFFACGEAQQKVCSLRKKSVKDGTKISSVQLNRLAVKINEIDKNILALRKVFQEAYCQGFAEALRHANREDMFSAYPNVKRVADLRGK